MAWRFVAQERRVANRGVAATESEEHASVGCFRVGRHETKPPGGGLYPDTSNLLQFGCGRIVCILDV